jgi:integrase
MLDITTKAARSKLPERMEPYWYPLTKGAAVGYRAKATGSWIARHRDSAGKQHYQALGAFPDFSAAKRAAEAWITSRTSAVHRNPSRGTVRDALAAYIRNKRSTGRRASAWDAGKRFRLVVGRDNSFGKLKLEAVRREDVIDWRNRLRKKGRAPRSINRQVRAVTAALNWAVSEGGFSGNREAWRLRALEDESEHASPIFLSADERARLIGAAPQALAAFLEGLSHLGARPSELARATVADFDARGATVTLWSRKGRNAKKRTRATELSTAGLEFFRVQVRGKTPKAPLIANDEGGHWTDQQWCAGIERTIAAINTAADKTKTPELRVRKGVSAYSFRHSRISELLQIYQVDPLTVCKNVGTSIQMLELHYFKFIKGSMRAKLDAVVKAS